MSVIDLPGPVRAFIDTTNAGDSEAFLDVFTPDATLDDWGRVYSGRDGLAQWNRTDNIGKRSHFALVDAQPGPSPESWVVTLTVTGDGFNGTGPMTFHVRDDRLSRVVITPHGGGAS